MQGTQPWGDGRWTWTVVVQAGRSGQMLDFEGRAPRIADCQDSIKDK